MIYKLTYENKDTALADLKAKNILIEVDGIEGEKHEAYGNGVQAVVEIGLIMLQLWAIRVSAITQVQIVSEYIICKRGKSIKWAEGVWRYSVGLEAR